MFISSIRTVHSEMTSTLKKKKKKPNVLKKQKFFDGSGTANRTQSHFYLSMPMNMKDSSINNQVRPVTVVSKKYTLMNDSFY